jgi:hypothetical protein
MVRKVSVYDLLTGKPWGSLSPGPRGPNGHRYRLLIAFDVGCSQLIGGAGFQGADLRPLDQTGSVAEKRDFWFRVGHVGYLLS